MIKEQKINEILNIENKVFLFLNHLEDEINRLVETKLKEFRITISSLFLEEYYQTNKKYNEKKELLTKLNLNHILNIVKGENPIEYKDINQRIYKEKSELSSILKKQNYKILDYLKKIGQKKGSKHLKEIEEFFFLLHQQKEEMYNKKLMLEIYDLYCESELLKF